MSIFKSIGKVLGKGLKIAAPFAGLIPGVGIPLSLALGGAGTALGRALSGDKFDLGATALGAGGAGLGAAAAGGQGLGGLKNSGLLKTIGKQFMGPDGKLDLAKLAGVGMAGANVIGAGQQRNKANKYNQAQADLRNQLLSRILAPPPIPGGRIV